VLPEHESDSGRSFLALPINTNSGRMATPGFFGADAPGPAHSFAPPARHGNRKIRPVRFSSVASRTIRPRASSAMRRRLTWLVDRPICIARRPLLGQQTSLPFQA
jgi:hypothetical protein